MVQQQLPSLSIHSFSGMVELWWLWILKRFLPVGFVVFCICMGLKLVDFLWWRPKRLESQFAKQGITGPPYRFFLGNVKEMVGLMEVGSKKTMHHTCCSHNILPTVLAFYTHWKKIYGSSFLLWFGPTARVMISDPELIREIFVSRSDSYEKYEAHPLVRQLEGDGLLSLKGEKWAHRRKVVAPTFYMANLQLLIPSFGESVVDVVDKWASCKSGARGGEVEVDVFEMFQYMMEDAMTRTAFGVNYDDGKPVFRLQAKQMVSAAESFSNVLIPGYRFLPTQKNIDAWRLEKEINRNLVRLVDTRKELKATTPEEEEDCANKASKGKDLLGLLIKASMRKEEDKSKMSSWTLTEKDIIEECKTFFFAGKHSTSNLLTWATVLISMHPEWQDMARDEVFQVCGSSHHLPTKQNLDKLKTLSMILNETLRLYPPAVATIRRAKADVMLGGRYKIPKGTELLIPILAVHHDPELWGPDVHEFNPGRFSMGVARASRRSTSFIPFGLGGRTCVGQNLALLESKLALAVILQRYSLRLSPSYVHAPTVLMLLHPRFGAPVIFRPSF